MLAAVLAGRWSQARPLLGRDAAAQYRWLALVLPLVALALSPPLLNRAVALALRALRRPPLPAPLTLAGVREAALVVLLGSTVPVPVAAVIAVVSRLLFVAGDLAWSAVAVVAARRLVRPPGPPPPPPA